MIGFPVYGCDADHELIPKFGRSDSQTRYRVNSSFEDGPAQLERLKWARYLPLYC